MTIAPDVQRIARKFGVSASLIQAVVNAEGNIVKAVQCSLPSVQTRDEALEVTCRSCAHAMSDYLAAEAPSDFIAFWGARWAPLGVQNDPTNLNTNWTHNVLKLWTGAKA